MADTTASAEKMPNDEILELAAESSRRWPPWRGASFCSPESSDRREGWRAEGATSLEAWIVERCGVSVPTARAWSHVAERLFDLPHLAAGLSEGELTFDKVRAVVDTATPESDREMKERARTCSVHELAQLNRSAKGGPGDRRGRPSTRCVRSASTTASAP